MRDRRAAGSLPGTIGALARSNPTARRPCRRLSGVPPRRRRSALEEAHLTLRAGGGCDAPLGNVMLIYTGTWKVEIARERREWLMEAPPARRRRHQYDLVLAGQAGRYYRDVFANGEPLRADRAAAGPRSPDRGTRIEGRGHRSYREILPIPKHVLQGVCWR